MAGVGQLECLRNNRPARKKSRRRREVGCGLEVDQVHHSLFVRILPFRAPRTMSIASLANCERWTARALADRSTAMERHQRAEWLPDLCLGRTVPERDL